jgi:hypothetical protein
MKSINKDKLDLKCIFNKIKMKGKDKGNFAIRTDNDIKNVAHQTKILDKMTGKKIITFDRQIFLDRAKEKEATYLLKLPEGEKRKFKLRKKLFETFAPFEEEEARIDQIISLAKIRSLNDIFKLKFNRRKTKLMSVINLKKKTTMIKQIPVPIEELDELKYSKSQPPIKILQYKNNLKFTDRKDNVFGSSNGFNFNMNRIEHANLNSIKIPSSQNSRNRFATPIHETVDLKVIGGNQTNFGMTTQVDTFYNKSIDISKTNFKNIKNKVESLLKESGFKNRQLSRADKNIKGEVIINLKFTPFNTKCSNHARCFSTIY